MTSLSLAQDPAQLRKTGLALILFPPTPGLPTGGNQHTCFPTMLGLVQKYPVNFGNVKTKGNLKVRQPQWKYFFPFIFCLNNTYWEV